jgi:hypothetical protein
VSVPEDSAGWRLHGAGVLALLACLVFLAAPPLQAQDGEAPPRLSSGRVAAQIGVGTLLTPIAFFGTGWLTDRLFEPDPQGEGVRRFQYAASFTATWLGAAAGPTLVGRDGRFSDALIGSAVGLGGAFLAARLGNTLFDDGRRSCNALCWSLGVLTISLPSIGATIAYDAGRQ